MKNVTLLHSVYLFALLPVLRPRTQGVISVTLGRGSGDKTLNVAITPPVF